MQEIELLLHEMCHEERFQPSEKEMDEALKSEEEKLIQTYFAHDGLDAARITSNTAVSLLHRLL